MDNNYNVVGDVAGNHLTLQALLAKMPPAELLCLGDPNDRGPRSKEVIEFLMKNGKTVQSNHAHMMTEAWIQSALPGANPHYYEPGLWPTYNGGEPTMDSYAPNGWRIDKIHEIIPVEHITFLKKCPMFIETSKFVFSHAPLFSQYSLQDASDLGGGFAEHYDNSSEASLIWNRYVPNKPHQYLGDLINIFGHNSSDKPKLYTSQYPLGIKLSGTDHLQSLLAIPDTKVWALCLDTSSAQVLTGLHLPTMTIYTQEYID